MLIPGGTVIYHNTTSLLRSTIVFGEDANVFRPERFLERSESEKREMFRHVELVFGYGRWMCSGKNIAFLEIGKVVVEVSRDLPPKTACHGIIMNERSTQAFSTPIFGSDGY